MPLSASHGDCECVTTDLHLALISSLPRSTAIHAFHEHHTVPPSATLVKLSGVKFTKHGSYLANGIHDKRHELVGVSRC